MNGSIDRTLKVINGEMPDRAPLFDLLRNDSVIGHFTGETLTVENAAEVVHKAFAPAIDATRSVRLPDNEAVVDLPDGRQRFVYRWTMWEPHTVYGSTAEYAAAKRKRLDNASSEWTEADDRYMADWVAGQHAMQEKLGDCFWMPCAEGGSFMGLMGEVGLEFFSYCLADCADVIVAMLKAITEGAVMRIDHLPDDHGIAAVMSGDDIAFHSGPLVSPVWLRKNYFPLLKQVNDAFHRKNIKVMFHSDGDLNPILDELVDAGIDGLNPIEILANMDVGEIHRRYPHLFMCGGIDVSQLLPFATPQEVYDTTVRSIEAAEGRLMVGSTTELNNEVPLDNFLAMRRAAIETKY